MGAFIKDFRKIWPFQPPAPDQQNLTFDRTISAHVSAFALTPSPNPVSDGLPLAIWIYSLPQFDWRALTEYIQCIKFKFNLKAYLDQFLRIALKIVTDAGNFT